MCNSTDLVDLIKKNVNSILLTDALIAEVEATGLKENMGTLLYAIPPKMLASSPKLEQYFMDFAARNDLVELFPDTEILLTWQKIVQLVEVSERL